MNNRNIKGKTAVVGVGESAYYRHGESPDPEFVLTIQAILAAARHAGIDPKDIDGFVSFSDDRNTAMRVSAALGVKELRWSTMQWGGGGAGGSGAVQQAAAAVASGFADTVVVYRGLAQGQFGRFGGNQAPSGADSHRAAYGMNTAASILGTRVTRFFHETGIDPLTMRAVSLATYEHAQANPRAVMYGKPLTAEKYDASRWICEPFRLFDCCQENDGAAALIVTSAERAEELTERPAYILAAAQGGGHRSGAFNSNIYDSTAFASAEFRTIAGRLFSGAGLDPSDVDVVQAYENFTGGVVMSLVEHGFCTPESANEVLTPGNLVASSGRLPLNTSGGNLAEAYIHGLELHVEAVRQIRRESVNQVQDAKVSFVAAGPMVAPASSLIYGSKETLS
ncbi:acetyl-CoA acetyltransferase [Rhodococcus sp. ACPA4]|uniref:thiolase C-terminal domain-containing protein n=1 Tax=Rhodococcus sp. ACPA4 TaxID=2028571 RepID=UPI000BB0F181|nr:acetyl-CoA acetyltransferase [Rhodococcus sp. ACPA4]PBC35964.1 acetyl-CoA acetyltransferase [Rhodococcus sp. ACPA4]